MRRAGWLLALWLVGCGGPPPPGEPPSAPPPRMPAVTGPGPLVLLVGLPPAGAGTAAGVAAEARALAAERIHPLTAPPAALGFDGERAWLRRTLPPGPLAAREAEAWLRALAGARPRPGAWAAARSRADARVSAACLDARTLAWAWWSGGAGALARPGAGGPPPERPEGALRVGVAGPGAQEVAAHVEAVLGPGLAHGPRSGKSPQGEAGALTWVAGPGGAWLRLGRPLAAGEDRAALAVAGALVADALGREAAHRWPEARVAVHPWGQAGAPGWVPRVGPSRFEVEVGPLAPDAVEEVLGRLEAALGALARGVPEARLASARAAVTGWRAAEAVRPEIPLARALGGAEGAPARREPATVPRVQAAARGLLGGPWQGVVAGGGDAARRDARPGRAFPLGLRVRPVDPCGA